MKVLHQFQELAIEDCESTCEHRAKEEAEWRETEEFGSPKNLVKLPSHPVLRLTSITSCGTTNSSINMSFANEEDKAMVASESSIEDSGSSFMRPKRRVATINLPYVFGKKGLQ